MKKANRIDPTRRKGPLPTPHPLFDKLIDDGLITNDRELADKLDVDASNISRIRTRKLPFGRSYILRLHEVFGLPVDTIRKLAA
jgi:hypothetical protein